MTEKGQPAGQVRPPEAALRRRGLQLAWLIVVWDVIEGAVAITAGIAAGSIALIGFGLDSTIEVFAASVVIWQLHGGERARARQAPALRLIALTFFVLAAYVSIESVRDLVGGDEAEGSIVGIVLNIIALLVMVPVALVQARVGRALDNPVLIAQSKETWLSNYLSVSLLVGLALNEAFGLWWADPIVALLLAAVALNEGRETWESATDARTGRTSP